MLELYGYFRSSAAYRVRIALNLKGLAYEQRSLALLKHEQSAPEYLAINPQGRVPCLVDGEHALAQSLAIIEYLDEKHPEPPLLPSDPLGRARVRKLAQVVACDIHPLDNLRVLRYLKHELGVSDEGKDAWYAHWIVEGFGAIERELGESPHTGSYCHGETPTIADLCLVPQCYNARRFNIDLASFPIIERIEAHCLAQSAFAAAVPERQPDAPEQLR
ncbi:MAG: maleylacetoacetate isomerase [Myxococcales bacterium]|nr:maleylacetoacetate isomerase [Myxococcales bacterium]